MTTQAARTVKLMKTGAGPKSESIKEALSHAVMMVLVNRPDDDKTTPADSMHIVGFEDLSIMIVVYENDRMIGAGSPDKGTPIYSAAIRMLVMEQIRDKAEIEAEIEA